MRCILPILMFVFPVFVQRLPFFARGWHEALVAPVGAIAKLAAVPLLLLILLMLARVSCPGGVQGGVEQIHVCAATSLLTR